MKLKSLTFDEIAYSVLGSEGKHIKKISEVKLYELVQKSGVERGGIIVARRKVDPKPEQESLMPAELDNPKP